MSYHESFSWVDPVVASRVFVNLTDRLSLQAQADIGGFGVGSDLTWSFVYGQLYAHSKSIAVRRL